MKKVIIIGGGPAGISASLYTVRAGFDTLVIAKDGGALERAERIENYYGLPSPLTGKELLENGRQGAERLGVRFLEAEVTAIETDGRSYKIRARGKEYLADGVIVATGTEHRLPPIEGVSQYLGQGVSLCAVCDSFAARRRPVAVVGAGDYALDECAVLLGVAERVTLCTNGGEPPTGLPPEVDVRREPVTALEGDGLLRRIRFEGGEPLPVAMAFLAVGTPGGATLLERLGLATEGGRILTDADGATALPGLYAAGDVTGGVLQIATAVADGARAGLALVRTLRARNE